MVKDEPAIRKFIQAKSKVLLLLEAGQEQFQPLAEQIAASLRKRGRDSVVRVIQPDDIHTVPLRWRRTERDKKIWDGMERGELVGYRFGLRTYFDPKQQVDHVLPYSGYRDPGPQHLIFNHVVLIGLPGENRFLKDAQKLAPRQISQFYPGQGRGLVQHVWSPFWAHKHAVTITAFEKSGLNVAVKRFLELINSEVKSEPPSSRLTEPTQLVQTFTTDNVEADTGISLDRSGSPITSLSISPDGKYIGVGAQFYGDNLFLFDKAGKLIWKDHVGVRGPDTVTVSKDAKRTYAYLRGKLLIYDKSGKGIHRVPVPRPSVGAKRWKPGPSQLAIHTQSSDLLLGGRQSLDRIGPGGKTKWRYSDVPWCHEALDFYHQRAGFIKAVSPDGRFILTALFGVQRGQLGYLSAYWKPGLALLDAESGKVIWRRQGITMNNTLGVTTGERTVVCDDDGVFHLINFKGELERSFSYPDGLEDMKLSPDGYLILRTAMARSNILQPYGRSMNLVWLNPSSTIPYRLDTSGEIRDFDISTDSRWIVASTWNDAVYLFTANGRLAWQVKAPGGCLVRFHPSSKMILAGAATGSLIWFDLGGRRIRTLDLMDSNFPRKDFVRSVKDDEDFPELEILPPQEQLSSVFERAEEVVDFKPVELPQPLRGRIKVLEQTIELPRTACRGNETHVVSFFVRAAEEWSPSPYDRINVQAMAKGKVIYQASMPIARHWKERLVSFKTQTAGNVTVRLTPERYKPLTVGLVASQRDRTKKVKPETPFILDRLRWARADYRSRNWLKVATADDLLSSGTTGGSVGEVKPRLQIPNPYPATYRMPFITPRIGGITFIDGNIRNPITSWLRGNSIEAKGITDGANHPVRYAHLYLTLPKPRSIAAIAVYEDPTGPAQMSKAWAGQLLREKVTSTYAVLLRDAVTKKWKPFGNVSRNKNVFNLFTGPAIKADMVHYFWAGSGDWHIRLAEIEAYSAASDEEVGLEELDDLPSEKKEADPFSTDLDDF